MKKTVPFLASWLISALLLPGSGLAADSQSPPLQLLRPQASGPNTVPDQLPAALHDIHGPIGIPEPAPYLLYGLIGLLALALLAGLFWWRSRSRNSPLPQIPPAMVARDALLQARELMEEEHSLSYMTRVSEILRRYIEARFGIKSTRRTTREFFNHLTGEAPAPWSGESCTGLLRHCLERCDMAKFAHQSATVDHLRDLEESVLAFINESEKDQTTTAPGGGS